MAIPDRRTTSVLLTILLFAVVLAVVYIARKVIVIFAFAILFAYLIDPVVRFLQRHSFFFKNLREPHILEAYLAFLVLISLAAYAVAPKLFKQADELFREVPVLVDDLSTGEIASKIGAKYGLTDDQQYQLKSFLTQHRTEIQGLLTAAKRTGPTVLGSVVLIPILAIFFLSDGSNLANSLIQLVSTNDNLGALQSLARELNTTLQHYIRTKVILGGLSFLYCSATMLVLGFPHALALGFLAGVLEFIPVAGWIFSAVSIISVGVLTHAHWIWMAVLLGIWRMLMDYAIAPRVMGRILEIHPLMAIFTMMVGGAVGGIVGVYLSVPLVAVLRVVWRRFVQPGGENHTQLQETVETHS
jgi:predicted PurR-regulated permease PerM